LVAAAARESSAKYISENLEFALVFQTRKELWNFACDLMREIANPRVIEFGVFQGRSINYFSKKLPDAIIFGFDSFYGLSEDWTGTSHTRGKFSTRGLLPVVGGNVKLISGLVEKTLPDWLQKNPLILFDLIHMDLDLYQPTKFVLNSISGKLKVGSLLIFDEYFGYPGYKVGEFKAFHEFCEDHQILYEYVGYTNAQVCARILKI
jgi:hypothetical protein